MKSREHNLLAFLLGLTSFVECKITKDHIIYSCLAQFDVEEIVTYFGVQGDYAFTWVEDTLIINR